MGQKLVDQWFDKVFTVDSSMSIAEMDELNKLTFHIAVNRTVSICAIHPGDKGYYSCSNIFNTYVSLRPTFGARWRVLIISY